MEMMFHALEDTILHGFLERGHFSNSIKNQQPKTVIPHEAVTAAQSLKPYARSLSHELRTPMQGVVGMLDVMYATVQEAAEGQNDHHVRGVLNTLKENIEVVQG
jgi:signal transduction histidine kinase